MPSSLWAASCSLLGFWVWAQQSSWLRSTESCGRQRAQSREAWRLLSSSIWWAKARASLALSSSTTGEDLRGDNENSWRCLLLKSPWRPQKAVAVERSLKKVEELRSQWLPKGYCWQIQATGKAAKPNTAELKMAKAPKNWSEEITMLLEEMQSVYTFK